MFTRYTTDGKGRKVEVAKVYTAKEHGIHPSQIDKDCLWAVKKLWTAGHKAYIVGGAVRDMLLGRRPKDFDIATSASPRQVQRLFWNSRQIGRRFKIVHLFFGQKIIEVTTFRSDEENFEEGNNNIYGTIEQDARRRDFSINALYYNPIDGHLLDFNDGMGDMKRRVIRSLIPLSYSFEEDPVRMIRALKYMCTTGFRLKWDVARAVKRDAPQIEKVSTSRLTDEMGKVLASGDSSAIFSALHKYGLLAFIMPGFDQYMRYDSVRKALCELDGLVRAAKDAGGAASTSEVIKIMVSPLVNIDDSLPGDALAHDLFRQVKVLIAPLTPPNYEIERAIEALLMEHGVRVSFARRRQASQMSRKNTQGPQRPAGQGQGARKRRRKGKVRTGQAKGAAPGDSQGPSSSAEAHDL